MKFRRKVKIKTWLWASTMLSIRVAHETKAHEKNMCKLNEYRRRFLSDCSIRSPRVPTTKQLVVTEHHYSVRLLSRVLPAPCENSDGREHGDEHTYLLPGELSE